jgi:hypothetical protein
MLRFLGTHVLSGVDSLAKVKRHYFFFGPTVGCGRGASFSLNGAIAGVKYFASSRACRLR